MAEPAVDPAVLEAQQRLDTATEIEDSQPDRAIQLLQDLIFSDLDDWKIKETAVKKLTKLLSKQKKVEEIRAMLTKLRPQFGNLPKAKTAKIVRHTLEAVGKIPNVGAAQIDMALEWVEWCKAEKRSYLRQRLELMLATLYLDRRRFPEALDIVQALAHEVKRLDDKPLLVEIFLLESRIHHALRNVPRARAALTAARTNANAIYCPPPLQAAIDMQAGTLYAEELDYKTAYSYFYEAFEGYTTQGKDALAVAALKYMLLCKIMTNNPEEVHAIITGKLALRYAGPDVEAMRAVAQAHTKRSLADFQAALARFKKELQDDPLIHTHLGNLYDTLLEQNLCRIVEPFSRVEIAHVAKLISLPIDTVESKLSQMIMDKKFDGVLDQGSGCLLVNETLPSDSVYPSATEVLRNMNTVLDALFDKCKKI